MKRLRGAAGFSLIELLFATGLLLVVSSIVTTALIQMTNSQKTIWNRTEMHSGIRGATELLQQEVGQAGRIATPESELPLIFATGCGGCNGVTSAMVQPICDPAAPSTGRNGQRRLGCRLWQPGCKPSYVMRPHGRQQQSRFASHRSTPRRLRRRSPPALPKHAPGAVLMPLGGFVTGIVLLRCAEWFERQRVEVCGINGDPATWWPSKHLRHWRGQTVSKRHALEYGDGQ